MANAWYYSYNNQQAGPVALPQLQQMIASGQLDRNTLVWTEGMAQWISAEAAGIVPAPGAPIGPAVPVGTIGYAPPAATMGAHKGKAIAAFVCSLAGVLCCGIVSLVGLILGATTLSAMKQTGDNDGQGLATAAVVIGIIGVIFQTIGTIFWVFMKA